MEFKKQAIITVFILLIGIVIATAFVYYSNEENTIKENTVIRDDESNYLISGEYITKLEPNTIPSFKTGEKWVYQYTKYTSPGENNQDYRVYEYFVKSVERFNKTECFLIIGNHTTYSTSLVRNNALVETCMDRGGTILYVDTNESYPQHSFSFNTYEEGGNTSNMITAYSFSGSFFYAPWMLSLTKEFKWRGDFDFPSSHFIQSDDKYDVKKEIYNFKYDVSVIGTEIINNIKCFKVQVDAKIMKRGKEESMPNSIKLTLWIDVDKRIVVKGRMYHENLPLAEIKRIFP